MPDSFKCESLLSTWEKDNLQRYILNDVKRQFS